MSTTANTSSTFVKICQAFGSQQRIKFIFTASGGNLIAPIEEFNLDEGSRSGLSCGKTFHVSQNYIICFLLSKKYHTRVSYR